MHTRFLPKNIHTCHACKHLTIVHCTVGQSSNNTFYHVYINNSSNKFVLQYFMIMISESCTFISKLQEKIIHYSSSNNNCFSMGAIITPSFYVLGYQNLSIFVTILTWSSSRESSPGSHLGYQTQYFKDLSTPCPSPCSQTCTYRKYFDSTSHIDSQ